MAPRSCAGHLAASRVAFLRSGSPSRSSSPFSARRHIADHPRVDRRRRAHSQRQRRRARQERSIRLERIGRVPRSRERARPDVERVRIVERPIVPFLRFDERRIGACVIAELPERAPLQDERRRLPRDQLVGVVGDRRDAPRHGGARRQLRRTAREEIAVALRAPAPSRAPTRWTRAPYRAPRTPAASRSTTPPEAERRRSTSEEHPPQPSAPSSPRRDDAAPRESTRSLARRLGVHFLFLRSFLHET